MIAQRVNSATKSGNRGPHCFLAVAVVAIAVLLLAAFAAFLRFNAQSGDRARFEALDADFLSGFVAVTVGAVIDSLQRFLDLADELAFAVAGAKLEAELGFLSRAIVWIREVRCLVLHMQHGAVYLLHQIALPGIEDLAEVLELLLVHVLLATPRNVRLYIPRAGKQVGAQALWAVRIVSIVAVAGV